MGDVLERFVSLALYRTRCVHEAGFHADGWHFCPWFCCNGEVSPYFPRHSRTGVYTV